MKPNTKTVMRNLIQQIRETIPFGLSEAYVCSDNCNGCSIKLLEFLDIELINWEHRLDTGETPNFGDLNRIVNTSRKVYKALDKNGLIADSHTLHK